MSTVNALTAIVFTCLSCAFLYVVWMDNVYDDIPGVSERDEKFSTRG